MSNAAKGNEKNPHQIRRLSRDKNNNALEFKPTFCHFSF